jgi:chemotaxis protein MotB
MLSAMPDKGDPSGMIVSPQLPVPKSRSSEPRVEPASAPPGRAKAALIGAVVVGTIATSAAAGYFLAPTRTAELAKTRKELAEAQTAAKVEADRAEGAKKQVEVLSKDKQRLEQKLAETSSKVVATEKQIAEANASAEKKLQAAIDKSSGSVSSEGEEIRLKLVDKVLFAPGDDQLTDKGKSVLAKVGNALVDLPDKQIWVQGHTDDTPIVVPPAPKPKKKGAKAEPAPVPRFESNWELSAARALQVVHYLQDVTKIDPARLAALAFGEYRPVSRSNKAQNRRIEIVLYPHKAVIEREAKPKKR